MNCMKKPIWLPVLCGLAAPVAAQTAGAVSEKDYFAEVPVVLSVSRLPQRLDETPGAVTIIDRQMIRLSGARDLAELPGRALSLDVRAYEEQVRDLIKRPTYSLPGSGGNNEAFDYVNGEDFDIHGYEYQLRAKPWSDGQLIYSQALVDSTQSVGDGEIRAYRSQSLMFMQQLPGGLDFSLMYYEADASHFPGANASAPAISRTDVRLAKSLRPGGRRAEISVVGQNLGASYPDFRPEFRFYQQAYVMLRLEN